MDKLTQAVVEFVKANEGNYDPAVDGRMLQAHLFVREFSMQVIVRRLPKILVQLALIPDPVENLKKAKDALTKELPEAIKGEAVRELVERVADQYNLPERTIVQAVKKIDPKALPPKPRLGVQKTAITNYFRATPEPTLKGLATYLQTAVPMNEEKALKVARMNFTFANELVKITLPKK